MDDAVTCGACLTLNPPGVLACVRCNTPLGASWPMPSGTGLPGTGHPGAGSDPGSGAAVFAAGSAAEQSTAVLGEHRPEPAATATRRRAPADDRLYALSPAAQRRVLRRIETIGAAAILLVLLAGAAVVWSHRPRTIDTAAVASTIEGQLSRQLGQPVRLACPDSAARTRGTTFTCTATDAAGAQRSVVVTVTGDDGAYQWQLR